MYGEDADYFSEQPHYTLVCDAREVEMEEEEVQYVSQEEIVRVDDGATKIISAYIDQGFKVLHHAQNNHTSHTSLD